MKPGDRVVCKDYKTDTEGTIVKATNYASYNFLVNIKDKRFCFFNEEEQGGSTCRYYRRGDLILLMEFSLNYQIF